MSTGTQSDVEEQAVAVGEQTQTTEQEVVGPLTRLLAECETVTEEELVKLASHSEPVNPYDEVVGVLSDQSRRLACLRARYLEKLVMARAEVERTSGSDEDSAAAHEELRVIEARTKAADSAVMGLVSLETGAQFSSPHVIREGWVMVKTGPSNMVRDFLREMIIGR